MRAGKGIDRRQRIRDPRKVREWRRVDIEELRAGRLAGETNVGERNRIAMAVAPGGGGRQMLFESGERRGVPMLTPFCARCLVELELVLQIFAYPRHDQRMRIAGDDLG